MCWYDHVLFFVFFFNDTATTEIYTLSLHDALPIFIRSRGPLCSGMDARISGCFLHGVIRRRRNCEIDSGVDCGG